MSQLFDSDPVPLTKKSAAEVFGVDESPVPAVVEAPPLAKVDRHQRWLAAMRAAPQAAAGSSETKVQAEARLESPPAFQVDLNATIEEEEEICIVPQTSQIGSSPKVVPVESQKPQPVVSHKCVPHLILVVHGVNGSEDSLDRNLTQMRLAFEQARQCFKTFDPVHIEMINWKSAVIGIQSSLFEKITPRHVALESRMFINYSISDVVFYLTPSHQRLIQQVVAEMLNSRVARFGASTKISLVGYSLGSVILHDLMETGGLLNFPVHNLFLWGSPLAAYLSVKDIEYQTGKFVLPNFAKVFNIYHPHDPVAFRIEPLFYHLDSELADSEMLPNWENNGLLSNKAMEKSFANLSASISDKWNAFLGAQRVASRPLVPHRRLDFVLQESLTENLSHKYSMLTAHYSYWSSRDVALFMLKTMCQPS